jgi:hypothetical protein
MPQEGKPSMTSQLYVYYKISRHGPPDAAMLRQMQAALAQQGVQVSLMRRQETAAAGSANLDGSVSGHCG